MVFSSVQFLLIFLPITAGAYFLAPSFFARNLVLLAASLAFYVWGEPVFFIVLLFSITVHWGFGLWIHRTSEPGARKRILAGGIAIVLSLLLYFKYSVFLCTQVGSLFRLWHGSVSCLPPPAHLPLGISFFTFQVISYLIDVYRGTVVPQPRWYKAALYKSFFPQLIAGPIVRYADISSAFSFRTSRLADVAEGALRFGYGLGQKVLIANVVGRVADRAFNAVPAELSPGAAWLGALSYAFQIYFDFNGYSNMAIGMGRVFGFRFLENFNHPYAAVSITDFWRRWHISLSTWFRDYVYIPLGGNRGSAGRTYLNLCIVFFLCGLWHGANYTFVAWGLFHGLLLVAERAARGARLGIPAVPVLAMRVYVWVAVLLGWVLFRCDSLPGAARYLGRMFSWGESWRPAVLEDMIQPEYLLMLAAAVVFSFPWWTRIEARLGARPGVLAPLRVAGFALILVLSLIRVGADTFNPFIYFRF